jgi:hypothetical protein
VNVVLAKDDNGNAAAWIKRYSNISSSGFIQIWVDPDFVSDMSFILRVAEHGFNEQ